MFDLDFTIEKSGGKWVRRSLNGGAEPATPTELMLYLLFGKLAELEDKVNAIASTQKEAIVPTPSPAPTPAHKSKKSKDED